MFFLSSALKRLLISSHWISNWLLKNSISSSIDFVSLKNLLELTDGNLASHTRNLEELGYIRSYKQFIGRKPNTTFSVTPEGKEAFKKHLNALENFLKNQLE